MDDRHLTLIVVPHGDLETRSFVISYGKLRLLLGVVAGILLVFCTLLALWFPTLAQAARVASLERELKELEQERAKVAELAQTLAEVEAQYEKVRRMLGADAGVEGQAPLLPPLRDTARSGANAGQGNGGLSIWPANGGGMVTRSVSDGPAGHPGVDIAVPANSRIVAAGDGVVSAAGEDVSYGRFVQLEHEGGLRTVYGHASRLYVKRGERVRAGQLIALAGSTGRATAPHLHFEVRRGGLPADPMQYLQQP
jgi:murein DD-endopeptidase MepM/ murein hydrolase activator NlpD